jgi:hypothetical protein
MTDKLAKRARRAAEFHQRHEQQQRQQQAQLKADRRLEKLHAKQKKVGVAQEPPPPPPVEGTIDVVCVIHGNVYTWDYVERLYNMVSRNLSHDIRFHVYTEEFRDVPSKMIKHNLIEWPNIFGPKKGWWYKMQIFNPENHSGPMLYFDLDTVVINSLDWIPKLSTRYFWAPRDFRSIWRVTDNGLNSSVMWWDNSRFAWIWEEFQKRDINHLSRIHHGDQDYLTSLISDRDLRFFPPMTTASWRWQCLDGGMDVRTRQYRNPNSGTSVDHRTSVLIFHGQPKPHEKMDDPLIKNFWQ